MKQAALLVLLLTIGGMHVAHAQAQAFRNFIIAANSPTNPKSGKEAFQVLGGEERFELSTWGKGWAISRGDERIEQGFLFNFDYESNDLYVKEEGAAQEVVVDKNSVRRFALFNGKDSLFFVKSITLDPQNKTFYQLLGGDTQGKVALLKHRAAKLIPVNKNDYMRNFNGDYTPHYRSTITYYVIDATTGVHVLKNPGKKDLLDLYPGQIDLINQAFQANKHIEEDVLSRLFDQINAL